MTRRNPSPQTPQACAPPGYPGLGPHSPWNVHGYPFITPPAPQQFYPYPATPLGYPPMPVPWGYPHTPQLEPHMPGPHRNIMGITPASTSNTSTSGAAQPGHAAKLEDWCSKHNLGNEERLGLIKLGFWVGDNNLVTLPASEWEWAGLVMLNMFKIPLSIYILLAHSYTLLRNCCSSLTT